MGGGGQGQGQKRSLTAPPTARIVWPAAALQSGSRTASVMNNIQNEILDKMKNPRFVDLIQKEISEDNELKELKVEKASLPSIKPAFSKLIHSS